MKDEKKVTHLYRIFPLIPTYSSIAELQAERVKGYSCASSDAKMVTASISAAIVPDKIISSSFDANRALFKS